MFRVINRGFRCPFNKIYSSNLQIQQNLYIFNVKFLKALLLSEQSLRYPNSPAAGNKYHIVDGGPPVNYSIFYF